MDPLTAGLVIGGGALLGGFGNMFSADDQSSKNRKARQQLAQTRDWVKGQYGDLSSQLDTAYSPFTGTAGEDWSSYRGAVTQYDPTQFAYDSTDPFAYDLNAQTQAFLDPTMNAQIAAATKAVEGSAANRGGLFSSATGKAIADRSQEIAKQSWKDALATAMQDRGFQYQQYSGDIERARQAKDQQAALYGQKIANLGNLAGMGMQATTQLAGQKTDLGRGMISDVANADLQIANLLAQSPTTGFGAFLSGAGAGAGAFAPIVGAMNPGTAPKV